MAKMPVVGYSPPGVRNDMHLQTEDGPTLHWVSGVGVSAEGGRAYQRELEIAIDGHGAKTQRRGQCDSSAYKGPKDEETCLSRSTELREI